MKNNFIIAIISLGISVMFFGCNSVKYVPKNEKLLVKNIIFVNDKKEINQEITDYIVQRPNQLVLGVRFPLYFYNLGNKDFENDFDSWKEKFPKRYKFTSGVFSEKQAKGIRDFKYNLNQWFLENGEAPEVFNSRKALQTTQNLTLHYYNEGYFKVKVHYEEKPVKKKKVAINYIVNTDKPYKIDSISTKIELKVLDSIYKTSKGNSFVKKGKQFRLSSFINEQNRLTSLFRNTGIFRFNKNAITFEADSSNTNYKTDIMLLINDSIANVPFKIQRIKDVRIFTDYSYNRKDEPVKDTINYNDYLFLSHEKLKYNPKFLLDAVFIAPNEIYKDENRELTRRHLRALENFRTVDVKYFELEDDSLRAEIYLSPFKKYGLGFTTEVTHSNIRQLGISGKLSFLNRNIFKGAEILKLSVQGSFLDSKDAAENNSLLNAWEIGGDISVEIPRFIMPFKSDEKLKSKFPKTIFTLGTSLQKNIGLDKQRYTGIIDYNWDSNSRMKHSFQILNFQFIKNLNTNSYFNIYKSEFRTINEIATTYFDESLTSSSVINFIDTKIDDNFEVTNPTEYKIAKNIKNRYNIIAEDVLVPSVAYTFTFNNSENYKDTNFSFFRARIAASGNLTSALAKNTDANNIKTLFNTPIAQFIRTDLEYKKFWNLSLEDVLGFRSFLGIAVPYGNSTTIPFSRSYFIGGPNDLRAWRIYNLGPGVSKTGLEYNVGNLKFISNLEYRFKILNNIKGALFIDAGNIWDISNSAVTESEAKFNGFNSIKDIAVGSGFGIRYDLSFILLRLDLGFKTYEPYLPKGNKWFKNYNFSNTVYNFGISYPF